MTTFDGDSSSKWAQDLQNGHKASISVRQYGRRHCITFPPDWLLEPIPEGHVQLLVKSIYGTKEPALNWHNHILEWMIHNGYLAVNKEKRIFKKTKGSEYIIHGLFVVDMMHNITLHISSCDELKKEFMDKYSKDFEITGGGLMKTFLGMEVE
jgi:hypothetical protein